MSAADFRDTLRILDHALVLLQRTRRRSAPVTGGEFRRLTRELDLLRLRFGQPPAHLQRN